MITDLTTKRIYCKRYYSKINISHSFYLQDGGKNYATVTLYVHRDAEKGISFIWCASCLILDRNW